MFFTIQEAADLLRVSHKTVRAEIKEGRLVAHRFGKRCRIEQTDLDAYVESCKTKPPADEPVVKKKRRKSPPPIREDNFSGRLRVEP